MQRLPMVRHVDSAYDKIIYLLLEIRKKIKIVIINMKQMLYNKCNAKAWQ